MLAYFLYEFLQDAQFSCFLQRIYKNILYLVCYENWFLQLLSKIKLKPWLFGLFSYNWLCIIMKKILWIKSL